MTGVCQPLAARNLIRGYHCPMFYPANPNELSNKLGIMFRDSPSLTTGRHSLQALSHSHVLAIISPHARFDVSGPVSAQAFKALHGQKVCRIFLLAPSHRVAYHCIVLPRAGEFSTPLGKLAVDQKAISQLTRCHLFIRNDKVFRTDDHAVELQLPFISYRFGNAKIVPMLVGDLRSPRQIKQVATCIREQLAPGDLVLVSADFTHYGAKYGFAPFRTDVMQNIVRLDFDAYAHLSNHNLNEFMSFKQRTGDPICGYIPICVLLAMLPKEAKAFLLDYDTCDARLGTLERSGFSVSYMAVAFAGSSWNFEHGRSY